MPAAPGRSHQLADALVAFANHHQFEPGSALGAGPVESRMLLWCIAGRGEVTIDGVAHPLVPGAFFVLPWGHHIAYAAAASNPALVGGVHVIPRQPRRTAIEYRVRHLRGESGRGFDRRSDVPLVGLERAIAGRQEDAPGLAHLAEYAVGWFMRGRRDEPTARSLGRLFLAEFVEYAARGASHGGLPTALRRVVDFVRGNVHRPVSIDELAAVAGCSAPTVWRLFRRHLGSTPVAWMQRLRMERAAELLATTTLRVGEVGRQVGVDDPYYFTRLFGKLRGITPSVHRRRTALVK